FGPRYSNDGSFLIYGMQKLRDFYADKVRLVKFERVSGKKISLLPKVTTAHPSSGKYPKTIKQFITQLKTVQKNLSSQYHLTERKFPKSLGSAQAVCRIR
ncbi:MAG: hypothetical protein KKG06_08210, partial [Bacteroidetes bacterium]|nr:hypothetical protein [Bacteroidota bacterium]MBU1423147.1 hypothetical protein [Bacteroidota bacterium]